MTDRRTAERRKRPASQWYWGDWQRDTALMSCSEGARGIWMDIMCAMHDGEPYGHLAVKGIPLTNTEAARICRVSVGKFLKYLDELERKGVPSRTDTGLLYSRRMVRDEEIRNARADGGEDSQNHPKVPRKDGGKDRVKDTPKDTPVAPSLGVSPAVAVASASANQPQQQRPRTDRFVLLLDKFPLTGGSRIAITEFLESLPNSQSADTWIARMLGYLDGLDMPNGRPATPEAIVTACRDWNPKGGYSPVGFRAFIERAMQPPKQQGSSPLSDFQAPVRT